MIADGFTISLGIISAGLFLFSKECFSCREMDRQDQVAGFRLLAELLLMMYALMTHDVIIAAGQTAILVLTTLKLLKNRQWYRIPTRIKVASVCLPLLAALAIVTTSTYQYRLLIPTLPIHIVILGGTAYVLYTFRFLFSIMQKDHARFNMHAQVLPLAGCALLLAYSTYRTDLVLVLIYSTIGWRALQQPKRIQPGLPPLV